jgi:hypothetical protein
MNKLNEAANDYSELHKEATKAGYTHKPMPNHTGHKSASFHHYEHPHGHSMSVSVNKNKVQQFFHAPHGTEHNSEMSMGDGKTTHDFNRLHAKAEAGMPKKESFSKELGKHLANVLREMVELDESMKENDMVKAAESHGFTHGGSKMDGDNTKVTKMTHPTGHTLKISTFHHSPKSINHHLAGEGTWSVNGPHESAMGHESSHLHHVLGKISGKTKA